jgi:maleylpyruvate isomerase
MKLYGYWRSSSSWRVRIALAHKQIEHEYVPVQLLRDEQQLPAFAELSPMRQIPVLEVEDDGRTRHLTQSMAIVEYLEERFPVPPLLPVERWARARVRELAEIVNSGIQPLQNSAVLKRVRSIADGAHEAWARHFIARGLEALETRARRTAGTYLAGDVVTLADVCLIPQLFSARRFGVEVAPFPTLLRVEAECEKLESFQSAHALAQPDAEKTA